MPTIHGMYGTPTWNSWRKMIERCTSKTTDNARWYSLAGVRVCRRWRKFENFLADMGVRPPGTSIDRFPDRKAGYRPGNCRWATRAEQARNRSDNYLIEANGIRLCKTDWAKRLGCNRATITDRVERMGMTPAQAVTVPLRSYPR